jgi:hypothetical protein
MPDMGLTVIEGRWEEICTRASELQGRRIRLIILPEREEAPLAQHASLLDYLGDYIGCVQGTSEPVSEQAEAIIGDIWAEKARTEGLDI